MKALDWTSRAWVLVLALGLTGASCATQKSAVLTKDGELSYNQRAETATAKKSDAATKARVQVTYAKFPLHFEANQGQTDEQVLFLSRGRGYTLFLTSTEAVLLLRKPPEKSPARTLEKRFKGKEAGSEPIEQTVLRMQLVGANPNPRIEALEELSGKVNYFIGNDPEKWRTNVPTYAKVEYQDVYPGIDLIYYGNQRQLEHDFIVAPGIDPKAITLAFEGADKAEIDAQGDLVLQTAGGVLRLHKPIVYQEMGSVRQAIPGRYVLLPLSSEESRDEGKCKVGFQVAAYDASRPLVIDPVLVYSTYLGGSEFDEATGITVDASGAAYVIGDTFSADFPTTSGAFDTTCGTDGNCNTFDYDVFVTKFNSTGSALIYSTYLGGGEDDAAGDIAVDAAGNAYVTGATSSTDLPKANPFQAAFGGGTFDAFVSKVNAAGSALTYSTYLGGSSSDFGNAIAVDTAGNAYVTGATSSTDFPTVSPLQSALGSSNAFVTKFNSTGSALIYSTYLGGNGSDSSQGIAVDAAGNAYVTGDTSPGSLFPLVNPFQSTFGGGDKDAFVAKLNPAGSALIYSTYLGGSLEDRGASIAVDAAGNAYVTGNTLSTNFPIANPLQLAFGGGDDSFGGDAFVTKLNPAGSALVYSTYLGGSDDDAGKGIALDASGNAYIAGFTFSPNFPTASSLQASVAGENDAFIAKFNPTGSALIYSTYLGGVDNDSSFSIAVDTSGNVYATGVTDSPDFPLVNPFQPVFLVGRAAFVAKIADTQQVGIMAAFESPEDGQPVSGITVIRGWAFATQAGVQINSVGLFIDGVRSGDISCCSERGDVQAAFPQFPSENTLNSGWGTTFNWGLLSFGTHTVRVEIESTAGELFSTETRTVTVVRPGDFEFLDQFDFSGAMASIEGDELVMEGVVVRDKATQQQKEIDARFRWFESSQSLGIVEALTITEVSSLRSRFFSLFAYLSVRLLGMSAAASAQAAPGVMAVFESPEDGQAVSGVSVIRGWAFAEETDASVTEVRLVIDEQLGSTIPCCSERGDVAAAFPTNSNALSSGWGITFNYGLLNSGLHMIGVRIKESTGASLTLDHNVTVVKLGGFEFLDQFDLSGAIARIEGDEIVVEGVVARDKSTQQTQEIDVRLRWFISSQALGIISSVG